MIPLFIGVQQVYDKDGDATNITMENNNKYIKVLQAQSPRPPDTWFPSPDNELLQPLQRTGKTKPAKLDKGLQRWKQLPQPLQVINEKDLLCYKILCYIYI